MNNLSFVRKTLFKIADFLFEGQIAFESVVISWLKSKPRGRKQYRTDGENIYYYDSHIVRKDDKMVPVDRFSINNQGYITPTTRKIFDTLMKVLGMPYRFSISGGFMSIIEGEVSYYFPSREWVPFSISRKKVLIPLKPIEEKMKEVVPLGKVIKEIEERFWLQFKLLYPALDKIFKIEIPGVEDFTFADIYAELMELRRFYEMASPEYIFQKNLDLLKRDFRYMIRRKFQTGEWDVMEVAKNLGLQK